MHVFTYGTLMIPQVWKAVVGRVFPTVGASVEGYEMFRVKDAEFPGITPAASGASIRGLVHLDVGEESIARLDRFEDDFYDRVMLRVVCDDGSEREARAYVVSEPNRAVLTADPWSAEEFVSRGEVEKFLARYAGFTRLKE